MKKILRLCINILIGVIVVFCGVYFRVYIPLQTIHNFNFDIGDYQFFAEQIQKGDFRPDCCFRGLGYSVFLAGIYTVFGSNNYLAVQIVQIILDLANALLVMVIADKIWRRKIGILAGILYFMNPFTSGIAGVILPEVFTITLLLFIFWLLLENRNVIRIFFAGALLGYIGFTRISFVYISFVIAVCVPWTIGQWKAAIRTGLVFLFGLLVVYSLPIGLNYYYFGKATILPPDNIGKLIFYLNYHRGRYPELLPEINAEFASHTLLNTYWSYIEKNYALPESERAAYQQGYLNTFLQEIIANPPAFVKFVLQNIVWLYDRHYLILYEDPYYPDGMIILRAINVIYLVLASIGVYVLIFLKKIRRAPTAFMYMGLLFLYSVTLLPLASNESRHTIVYYPFIILLAASAFGIFIEKNNHISHASPYAN